jgi:CRP-like cAMP-binding protein
MDTAAQPPLAAITKRPKRASKDHEIGSAKSSSVSNSLIDRLPRKERSRLFKVSEPVDLVFGDILSDVDQPIAQVYFPRVGFISLITSIKDHEPLEMGLVGNEGMLGATLALGINEAPMRAVVQGAGTALRLSRVQLRKELCESPRLGAILDRYLYVSIIQLARSSACLRFHELAPRLARWLLMTHDRAHADQFHLTHEFLADMLGVRRSGVSIAAHELQRKKLIRYKRGTICILDRPGLEAASCDCYAALLKDYTKVFN